MQHESGTWISQQKKKKDKKSFLDSNKEFPPKIDFVQTGFFKNLRTLLFLLSCDPHQSLSRQSSKERTPQQWRLIGINEITSYTTLSPPKKIIKMHLPDLEVIHRVCGLVVHPVLFEHHLAQAATDLRGHPLKL